MLEGVNGGTLLVGATVNDVGGELITADGKGKVEVQQNLEIWQIG